jgi:hypothetical protein
MSRWEILHCEFKNMQKGKNLHRVRGKRRDGRAQERFLNNR